MLPAGRRVTRPPVSACGWRLASVNSIIGTATAVGCCGIVIYGLQSETFAVGIVASAKPPKGQHRGEELSNIVRRRRLLVVKLNHLIGAYFTE